MSGPTAAAGLPTRRIRRPHDFRERYGPWAVVTGASSGIGKECARVLAAAGLDVVLVARSREPLDLVAAELETLGTRTRVVTADLSQRTGTHAVVAQIADLDVGLLVAAAGFGTAGPFVDSDLDAELEMLDVNCRATTVLTHAVARRLVARGHGGIVLFGSVLGRQGTPFTAHYAATKAWVQTLAEGLHAELRPKGVDLVATMPGPVHTGFGGRAHMTMPIAARPVDVAVPTLEALRHRSPTVAPGLLARAMTWSMGPLPRRVRTVVLSRAMAGMTSRGASSRTADA